MYRKIIEPLFYEINGALEEYLEDVTNRIIREEVFDVKDDDDAPEVPQLPNAAV